MAPSIAAPTSPTSCSRPQRVRDFFGLSAERWVVCGISFGFADAAHPANGFRTTRADDAVSWVD